MIKGVFIDSLELNLHTTMICYNNWVGAVQWVEPALDHETDLEARILTSFDTPSRIKEGIYMIFTGGWASISYGVSDFALPHRLNILLVHTAIDPQLECRGLVNRIDVRNLHKG